MKLTIEELTEYIELENNNLIKLINEHNSLISYYKEDIRNPNNQYKSIDVSILKMIDDHDNYIEPQDIISKKIFLRKLYKQKNDMIDDMKSIDKINKNNINFILEKKN
jgi:hypothetical protein